MEYDLPPGQAVDRKRITVKFQAHAGQITGGIFDMHVVMNAEAERDL